ncbi:TetR/AcrR family transcriptional regulator [Leucobacter musarum]|uniref:TetR/AcrR family transcriptional regulator n=1 Tax=Leucobacter musarum TaxID=1930747 RepID=UPI0006A7933F|nr:TetR/AcrR family transcriptional regulator [Leucobacter musarum]
MTERRARRKPGENRQRLREAGLIEFGLFGFQGASTAGIAARADVPQPHVYASFATKQALFLECCTLASQILTGLVVPSLVIGDVDVSGQDAELPRVSPQAHCGAMEVVSNITTPAELQCVLQAFAALGVAELRAPLARILAELRDRLGSAWMTARFGSVAIDSLDRALCDIS